MENIIKVIHVFGSLNVGGAESRIMDVFRKIDKSKVMFDFITLDVSENQYFENEIRSLGGTIFKVPSPIKVGFFKHLNIMKNIFKTENKDCDLIVHAHTLHHCGIVLLAAKMANVRIRIAHARNTKAQQTGVIAKVYVFIGRTMIKIFATERLSISREAAEFLYGKRYLRSGKVLILPNAIDLAKYEHISEIEIKKLKTKYNINENQIVIGHVGRFEPVKNHQFLIQIFSEFCKNHPNSKLILIGDGLLRNDMELLVNKLNLNNDVVFLGIRNDVEVWMKIFDTVVLPSHFEGLCGVALEAQAAGTPSLLSKGIPRSVNLNLGLVTFLPLNENVKFWVSEVEKKLTTKKPSWKEISYQFEKYNMSLEKEISMLKDIYQLA